MYNKQESKPRKLMINQENNKETPKINSAKLLELSNYVEKDIEDALTNVFSYKGISKNAPSLDLISKFRDLTDRINNHNKNYINQEERDFLLERKYIIVEIKKFEDFIKVYWEDFYSGINTKTINNLRKQLNSTKEDFELYEADQKFSDLKKDVEQENYLAYNNSGVNNLLEFIQKHWDNAVRWLTKAKVEELNQKLYFNEVSNDFKNSLEAVEKNHFSAFYRVYDSLKGCVDIHWDNAVEWLTKEKIESMKQKIDAIIWVPQKWEVYRISWSHWNHIAHIDPNNGDDPIIINDNKVASIQKWAIVEFMINGVIYDDNDDIKTDAKINRK